MIFILENNSSKYILKHKIGNGATCECYTGQSVKDQSSEIYAVKIFQEKFYEFYLNEVSFLSKLNNNNSFIKLYDNGQGMLSLVNNDNDTTENENYNKQNVYYQILEYANNGELKDYVKDVYSRISEKVSAKIFMKIVIGVKYLHDNNIAHCDLKPENILIDKYFNPKINDFGFSKEFDGKNGNFLIHQSSRTPIYSSPDVRLAFTKGYDGKKNDIFSLGVLLFVITIGDFPFESATYSDDKYKFIIKGRYNNFWNFFSHINTSGEFKDLINKLISLNPAKRLSVDEILKHPWLVQQLGEKYNELYNNISKYNSLTAQSIDQDIFDELSSKKV